MSPRRTETRPTHRDRGEFCPACGRPGPATSGMAPDTLRERAEEWRREAMRLETRASMLERGKGA